MWVLIIAQLKKSELFDLDNEHTVRFTHLSKNKKKTFYNAIVDSVFDTLYR